MLVFAMIGTDFGTATDATVLPGPLRDARAES
jgi:hypothetical protein